MIHPRKLFLVVVLMGLTGVALAEDSGTGGYKILRKVSLPGDGGWDFVAVDSDARRVYLTHDKMVQVLDADSSEFVGTIEGTDRAHGIALVPQLHRGFITSGNTGSVIVFDLKTLKRLDEVPARKDADAITYDPATGRVFSFNGDSQNVTVIEADTGKVISTVDLGGSPESAVADGNGYVFDNLASKGLVLKVDAKTLNITDQWPTAPGTSPTGIAIDEQNHRLFVGCRNKLLVVMDSTNGHIIQTLPIGERVDTTLFDAKTNTVFNSCGDGTLTVIHADSPDQYHVVENAATEPGARTLALDSKTGYLWLPTAKTLPPPAPTKDNPKPRRTIVPGTFEVLVVGKEGI